MTELGGGPPARGRYRFDEVRDALRSHWGLSLHRGGDRPFGDRDGRWDTCHSRTGFVVGGHMPGIGHSYRRFASLARIVRVCDLERTIARSRST